MDILLCYTNFNMILKQSLKYISEEKALESGLLNYIGEDIDRVYIEKTEHLILSKELLVEKERDINIVDT